ncbi:hypothetical protein LCGC14_0647850 [marine sediment metagenome]|uniref:Uncharacterized protein n=1 Tax=marine sediment metagenome TaxID=412755 RepID=A0A0F9TIX5_9ZZZZ
MPRPTGMPIGPGAGPGVGIGGVPGGDVSWFDKLSANPKVKGAAGGIFAYWLLNKLLQAGHESGMRGIQRASLQNQAEMITPESLYFQAAQPQAQEEESMARQALYSQLSGGVLGPSLAKGEYMIGG